MELRLEREYPSVADPSCSRARQAPSVADESRARRVKPLLLIRCGTPDPMSYKLGRAEKLIFEK